jgi:hypothetical protein
VETLAAITMASSECCKIAIAIEKVVALANSFVKPALKHLIVRLTSLDLETNP